MTQVSDPAAQASDRNSFLTDPAALSLLLAAVLVITANNTISPALPGLAARFADTPNADFLVRLLVPAPSFAVVLFAPFTGWLGDRIGRAPMFLGGVALFAITGGAGALLPSLEATLAARLLMGIGVATIMTAQSALIGDCFDGARRSAFMGLQTSVRNFGGLVFILLSGWLASLSPRLPFAIYGAAFLVLPLIWVAFGRTSDRNSAASGTAALPETAPGTPWLIPVLAASALQLGVTILFFFLPTQTPFYAQHLGLSPAMATSWTLGAAMLCGGFLALSFAPLTARLGRARVLALAFALMAVGFASFRFATGLPMLMLAGACLASGYGLVMPSLIALVLGTAPVARRGLATGMLTTGLYLGQVASPFVSQPAIVGWGWTGAYQAGALVFAGLTAAALLWPRR
ncbi:MFS transporter [Pseudoruegeria sp. HB172150]|uniref:MFS transporter n=1 Tax=Pseudoruegeria sp. HB172150 TaxID=2721164 RepID=UPI0015545A53|nr:MFS transporter [Pseudoruegeria sp. HB172150]